MFQITEKLRYQQRLKFKLLIYFLYQFLHTKYLLFKKCIIIHNLYKYIINILSLFSIAVFKTYSNWYCTKCSEIIFYSILCRATLFFSMFVFISDLVTFALKNTYNEKDFKAPFSFILTNCQISYIICLN